MDPDPVEEFFEHHGVVGMKWGHRKRSSGGSPRGAKRKARKEEAKDHKEIRKLRSKKVSQLTSKELKLVNERLNLEKNFNSLNPKQVSKGRAATMFLLDKGGNVVVKSVTNVATKGLTSKLEKKFLKTLT